MSAAKDAVIALGSQYATERGLFLSFLKALSGASEGIPALSILHPEGQEAGELVYHGVRHRLVHYFLYDEKGEPLSLVRLESVDADRDLSIIHHHKFVFDRTGAVTLGGTNGKKAGSIPKDAHEILYFLLSGVE